MPANFADHTITDRIFRYENKKFMGTLLMAIAHANVAGKKWKMFLEKEGLTFAIFGLPPKK